MNKSIKSILILCLAVLATLAAGLATGLLAGFLSNLVYVVFLFPLGMGLIGGFFLEKTIGGAAGGVSVKLKPGLRRSVPVAARAGDTNLGTPGTGGDLSGFFKNTDYTSGEWSRFNDKCY